MAATKRDVPPILDIQSAEFAHQYQLSAHWARYGDEQGNGPQSDTYFIANVTTLMENGHVDNSQNAWFPKLGLFLGMVRGGLHVTRGYRAGRAWFFYESDPNERRSTDASLMRRLRGLATERREYRDAESTLDFTPGCILGELSGQLFPLTQAERERIQEEDRLFLAECEVRTAGMSEHFKLLLSLAWIAARPIAS